MSISSIDQLGRKIELDHYPTRIISLVPSISELIWDLNLKEELCGITKFCIHPDEMFHSKTRVGGTKNLHINSIQKLQPDLLIGNKEENTKDDIEQLEKQFPVWMSDVNTVSEAISMIRETGKICNRVGEAEEIIRAITNKQSSPLEKKRVVYLIWHDPSYAAGSHTFINALLSEAGFQNLVTLARYPEVSGATLKELNPDFLFLSSEPYPFQKKHIDYYSEFIDKNKIIPVDGEMFSWYGSRLIKAYDYFKNLYADLNQRR